MPTQQQRKHKIRSQIMSQKDNSSAYTDRWRTFGKQANEIVPPPKDLAAARLLIKEKRKRALSLTAAKHVIWNQKCRE
jgi:hypothetical protein